jgi:ribonucleoside-diphosphate reductase alpha chain
MYYLRTKAAVDAIKFTLDNRKKEEPSLGVPIEGNSLTIPEPSSAPVQVASIAIKEEVDVKPMTAAEMKALIAQAKANEGEDDCLMCGS